MAFILIGHVVMVPFFLVFALIDDPKTLVNYYGKEIPLGEVRGRVILMLLFWWGFAASVGLGAWYRKPWSRHIFFGVFGIGFILAAVELISTQSIAALFANLVGVGAVAWYLYRKDNVVEYFDAA